MRAVQLVRCMVFSFLVSAFIFTLRKTALKDRVFLKGALWSLFIPVLFVGRMKPGCSYLIELDENGEISKYRVTSPGTITVSSSEFVEARKAREAKHAEYERLAEESALRRKMLAQETDRRFYQNKAVSAAAYEAAVILK